MLTTLSSKNANYKKKGKVGSLTTISRPQRKPLLTQVEKAGKEEKKNSECGNRNEELGLMQN